MTQRIRILEHARANARLAIMEAEKISVFTAPEEVRERLALAAYHIGEYGRLLDEQEVTQ